VRATGAEINRGSSGDLPSPIREDDGTTPRRAETSSALRRRSPRYRSLRRTSTGPIALRLCVAPTVHPYPFDAPRWAESRTTLSVRRARHEESAADWRFDSCRRAKHACRPSRRLPDSPARHHSSLAETREATASRQILWPSPKRYDGEALLAQEVLDLLEWLVIPDSNLPFAIMTPQPKLIHNFFSPSSSTYRQSLGPRLLSCNREHKALQQAQTPKLGDLASFAAKSWIELVTPRFTQFHGGGGFLVPSSLPPRIKQTFFQSQLSFPSDFNSLREWLGT